MTEIKKQEKNNLNTPINRKALYGTNFESIKVQHTSIMTATTVNTAFIKIIDENCCRNLVGESLHFAISRKPIDCVPKEDNIIKY